jgi:hypothetical protein
MWKVLILVFGNGSKVKNRLRAAGSISDDVIGFFN